ncbi:response regulator [Methylobacter sp. S3L5C]|uniref:response regulator n=1 Tax=Methylobacter sp. S3L5C TaxID=2839024 RepID=UPI001FAB5075|nr:response regulator [Methylobacter sp. S3L5C]UOA09457.1 response regulator [Methylobacter sp. S3L5C]
MISVLLVDDNEIIRAGIEALLNSTPDINVVGVASSGEEAIDAMTTLSVDVLLMAANLPGIGSIEACRRILQDNPEVKVITLSVSDASPVPPELFKLGVMGFISKESPVDEIINAIHGVMTGGYNLNVNTGSNLVNEDLSDYHDSPFSKLSRRESEVVTLILQGKSIKEMSKMLILSDKTVNTYRYRLYDKLNIKNDVQLTRLAIKFGHIDAAFI